MKESRHQTLHGLGPVTVMTTRCVRAFLPLWSVKLIDRHSFRSKLQARLAVFDYIEGFYNPHRRHSSLDYLSPINYESRHSDVA